MAKKLTPLKFGESRLVSTVGHGRTKLHYEAERVIFSQGEAAESVFYILSGKVKLSVTSKQGKEAVVALLGEGDFFGEGCLLAQPSRLSSATPIIRRYCDAHQ